MTDERTEEAAFDGLLHLTVGGKPVELRVLTIGESNAWKRAMGSKIAGFDVPETGNDGGVLIGNMLVAGPAAKLDMLTAYDVEGKLGSRESLEKRMTQAELSAAFEAMLDAENPKEEAANRSVVEAFGRPTLMVQVGLEAVQKAAWLVLESPTNGRSLTGDLTHEPSAVVSPTNSSSSSGPTDSTASNGRQPKRKSRRTTPTRA